MLFQVRIREGGAGTSKTPPALSSTVNSVPGFQRCAVRTGFGSTTCPLLDNLVVYVMVRRRVRLSHPWPMARNDYDSGAREIHAFRGVHANGFSLVNERRHLHHQSGFGFGRLGNA